MADLPGKEQGLQASPLLGIGTLLPNSHMSLGLLSVPMGDPHSPKGKLPCLLNPGFQS